MKKKRARVGADVSKWSKLAASLEALEHVTATGVITASGEEYVIGEDWTPPAADAPVSERVDYLTKAVAHIKETMAKAKTMGEAAGAEAYEDATKGLEAAKGLAVDIGKEVGIGVLLGPGAGVLHAASEAAPETTKAVTDKLKDVAQSIEDVAKEIPGFLFWFGAIAVTWQMVLTAGVLYLGYKYYVKPKYLKG